MKFLLPTFALLALPACLDESKLAADSQDANTALPPPGPVPANGSAMPAELSAGDAVSPPAPPATGRAPE